MTKIQRVGLMLWVGTTLVLLAGCNKLLDYLHDHPDGTVDLCQIKTMRFYFFNDSTDIDITYNSWGGPVSTIKQKASGPPDGLFRYDSKHRLTDYIEAYKNGSFETWHRYVYDKDNRVVRDTTYIFGLITDEPPSADEVFDRAVVYYEYDDKDRIIHTKQQWFSDPDPTHSLDLYYQYDGNGNLVIPGAVYDDKINVHRTNKVWMFIDRNYSVNNVYASDYNEYGLPAKVDLRYPAPQLAGFYSGQVSITYKCK